MSEGYAYPYASSEISSAVWEHVLNITCPIQRDGAASNCHWPRLQAVHSIFERILGSRS
jgi:hypothetical protein